MRRIRFAVLFSVLATLLLGLLPASAATTQTTRTFYLRHDPVDGGGCGGAKYLSTRAGAGEPGCGYIGGLPFNEVLHQLGEPSFDVYATGGDKFPGMPAVLDGAGAIDGSLTVNPYVSAGGPGTGVGQVILDVRLSALTSDNKTLILGEDTFEKLATPAASVITFAYKFDLDDALNGVEIKSLTIETQVRGAHVLHGYHTKNGSSSFKLPILVETTV